MASQLSEHEIMDLRNIFLELDKNGDGTLTIDELAEGIITYFSNNKDCLNYLNSMTRKFNQLCPASTRIRVERSIIQVKKITHVFILLEFLAATMERNVYLKEEKLFLAFKMFDKDGNGKISPQELKEALGRNIYDFMINIDNEMFQSKDSKFWDNLIKEADLDGDGEVNSFSSS